MYLRRRSQLLADVVGDAPSRGFDKNYMRLRSQLLTLMYGSPPELRRTSRSDSTATFHVYLFYVWLQTNNENEVTTKYMYHNVFNC